MADFHIESFILFVVDNPPPPLISSLFLPFLAENLLLSVFPPLFYYYPMFYSLILYDIPSQWTLFLASTEIPR